MENLLQDKPYLKQLIAGGYNDQDASPYQSKRASLNHINTASDSNIASLQDKYSNLAKLTSQASARRGVQD